MPKASLTQRGQRSFEVAFKLECKIKSLMSCAKFSTKWIGLFKSLVQLQYCQGSTKTFWNFAKVFYFWGCIFHIIIDYIDAVLARDYPKSEDELRGLPFFSKNIDHILTTTHINKTPYLWHPQKLENKQKLV